MSVRFPFVCVIFCSGLLSSAALLSAPAVAQTAMTATLNNAFNEGMRMIAARQYADAAAKFYQVMATADTPEMRDKAQFALANELRRLALPYGAAFFLGRIAARGPNSSFFREAVKALSEINMRSPLGRATILGIFSGGKLDALPIPPEARGFFHFYKGLDAFEKQKVAEARDDFDRVPSNSPYYARAQYYRGVILTMAKDLDPAIAAFNHVIRARVVPENLRELAILGVARVNYEQKRYRQAFQSYAQIQRHSDLWLQTLFEGSWTYFMIQKHNNALGNIHTIHSPFFAHRFFPESYILNAITYLYLCRYDKVKSQLEKFKVRYKPTFDDLSGLLTKYQGQPAGFYSLIGQYRSSGFQRLREYSRATEVIDSMSRADAFKETQRVLDGVNREARSRAGQYSQKWAYSGLDEALKKLYEDGRHATVSRAGEDLYGQAVQAYKYLKDLSAQTELIEYQQQAGQVDQLRSKLQQEAAPADSGSWGEGMKPLDLTQELEYWPFEGEYWEDELGGYVYNIGSKCGQPAK